MPIPNATTSTTAAPHIRSEKIERMMRKAVGDRAYGWQLFTFSPDLRDAKTATSKAPIYDNLPAATAHTESVEVASVELIRTVQPISTNEFATATFITDRAERLSESSELMAALTLLANSIQLKVDDDALALAASMANTQGNSGQVMDAANLAFVLANFRAQIVASATSPIAVMSTEAIRDLHDDALTGANALFGGMVGTQLFQATGGTNMGLRTFGNLIIWETDGLPTIADAKANFICLAGPTEAALHTPIGKDIMVELQRKANRIGSWVVASDEHGAGINEQDGCRRFDTRL